jgi:hypothetical protein
MIDLVVNGGTEIGKAVYSAMDLAGFASNLALNYSLAGDITLPDNWADGPTAYTGKFYGNGYTIDNLKFTAITTQSMGLFKTVGPGAELRDFTLVVVPASSPPSIPGNLQFGGVVGNIAAAAGTATISGVTITGTLALGALSAQGFVYVGGIIGELNALVTTTLIIENCVSSLNISLGNLGSLVKDAISVGGLVGNEYRGTINLRDSYSSGDITVIHGSNAATRVGGLIGFLNNVVTTTMTVDHCYSTSSITSTHTNATGAHQVGGLVGGMTIATHKLNTSVALNPSIVATGGTLAVNRAVGSQGAGVISNVYALSDAADGAANGVQGLAKTETQLRTASIWTGDLSFNGTRDVWDFSGLATGWPVHK